jgi:hypothetical protein
MTAMTSNQAATDNKDDEWGEEQLEAALEQLKKMHLKVG